MGRTGSSGASATSPCADGRLPMANLSPADLSDTAGARTVPSAIRGRWPWLKHPLPDTRHGRTKPMEKVASRGFFAGIARRSRQGDGLEVTPRRRAVDRTLGWMIRWRRLVRGYEKRPDVSKAMSHVAIGALLLRRVAHRRAPKGI